MRWRARVLIFAVGLACGPVAGPAGSPAPTNSCTGSCPAYASAGVAVVCNVGTCIAQAPFAASWTAVITLSQDATYYATAPSPVGAPGATFLLPLGQLLSGVPPPSLVATCQTGSCAALPAVVTLPEGRVDVSVSAAIEAKWNLGNTGVTTLPVQATLWPQTGTSGVDAVSLGLPVEPIALTNSTLASLVGPGGGPGFIFTAAALPPLVYQAVLQPLAPFEEAYPPEIRIVDLTKKGGLRFDLDVAWGTTSPFDTTIIEQPGPMFPTFDFSRADMGSLEGWTAWLRDQTTLRRISNLARLHGSGDVGVQLLTRHNAGDALNNAQLLVAPDPASGLPIWIFTPTGEIGPKVPYPQLPPSVEVSGTVDRPVTQHGVVTRPGVPADIVFEATGVCRYESNGTLVLDNPTNPDFTFSRQVTTTTGRYSVQLPLGQYKVTVIPHDTLSALMVVKNFDLSSAQKCQPVATAPRLDLLALLPVSGTAMVADGRPLAGATVEVVPTKCADTSSDPTCLPRPAQAIVAADGTYSLSLDPGAYLLRVRPAEGTHFPWVVQLLSVNPSTTAAPPTVVPAPVPVSLQLVDPAGNAVQEAVVRVFEAPATGSAYEIGAAITDGSGHFDMYLAPATQ